MADQWYCKIRRLNPPIEFGGIAYSLALVMADPWRNRERETAAIVSGVVERVDSMSGNRKRIVCQRAFKNCSHTEVRGPGDSIEIETVHLCGGNVACTPEPLRVYSWNEATAARGSDGRTRAQAGDLIRFAGTGPGFLVLEGNAMTVSPIGGVSWQGTEALPIPWRFEGDAGIIELDDEESTLEIDGDGIFGALQVRAVGGDPETEVTLTRKIWTVNGTPQPDWYPPDAEFGAAPAKEFWVSPLTNTIRLASANWYIFEDPDGDLYRCRFWLRGADIYAVTAAETVGVKPETACNYGGAEGDEVAIATEGIMGDLDRTIDIVAGTGGLEWRRTLGTSDDPALTQVAVLTWGTHAGQARILTNSGGARVDPDGAFSTLTTAAADYDYPFQVRVEKVGGLIRFSHRQDDEDSWVVACSATLTDVLTNHDGMMGLVASTTGGVQAEGFNGDLNLVEIAVEGEILVRRVQENSGIKYSTGRVLEASTAVTSVRNMTTGDEMVVAGTEPRARNEYAVSGGTIYIWSEAGGDWIRVIQAADTGNPPTKPGDPPRVTGIERAADGGSVATDNRMNWHDELVVSDVGNLLTATPGESFEVIRMALFDPRNPPTIQWDVRDDGGRTWETLAESNYLGRWADGVILITKAWMDARIAAGQVPCFRIYGNAGRQACGWAAEVYNDLRKVLIHVPDQVWHRLGQAGAEVLGMAGCSMGLFQPYPGQIVDGEAVSAVWGTKKYDVGYKNDQVIAAGGSLPNWWWDYTGINPGNRENVWEEWKMGSTYGTAEIPYGEADCGEEEEYLCHAAPFSLPTNRMGGMADCAREDGTFMGCSSFFQFVGIPFTFGGLIPYLAGIGAEILEARCVARVEDLEYHAWTIDDEWIDLYNRHYIYRVNGAIVYEIEVVDGEIVTQTYGADVPVDLMPLSLSLVGKRKNTSAALELGLSDRPLIIEASQYRYLGGGMAAGSVGDDWAVIDITEAAKASMIASRSDVTSIFLFPDAGPAAGTTANGLIGYVQGLMPSHSCSFNGPAPGYGVYCTSQMSGAWAEWSAMEFKDFHLRYRLPSGRIDEFFTPVPLPAIPHL